MKLDKEEVIRNIQRAIENGANSLKAITKVTGYNPNTIIKYYPEAPRGKKYSKTSFPCPLNFFMSFNLI